MNRLAKLSLNNRSFIALVCIAVSIIGIFAMTTMRQELIPSVSLPQVQVMTSSPGSSSEQVQKQISKPVEQALTGIEDVEKTSSTSQSGVSMVTVELDYGTDTARATNQVDAAIGRIQDQLPEGADPQVISGGTSDLPAAVLSVSSDLSPAELADRLDSTVTPELERVDGVSSVQVVGAPEEIVRITPDEKKLEDAGLSDSDIQSAVEANGLSMPGGKVSDKDQSVDVVVGKEMTSLDDLRDMVLMPGSSGGGSGGSSAGGDASGQQGGDQSGAQGQAGGGAGDPSQAGQQGQSGQQAQGAQQGLADAQGQGGQDGQAGQNGNQEITTLGDVAKVEKTTEDPTSVSRTDGRQSLAMMVTATSDGNVVDISHDVTGKLEDLLPEVGGDAKSDVVFDQAPFIQESIVSLAEEGLLGLVMAVGVILLFLRRLRPTLVTAISIPTSLLIAFIGMLVTGYTLNMLTLAALTISIGRVVDDSIVVIENITRHLAYGKTRIRAILDAVKEVAGAITASTLATVVVFLPIAIVAGMAGELFRPFALTVAIAMLSSLLVSLTIVPVLAYWFLRPPKKQPVPDDPDDEAQVAKVREAAEAREERTWLHRLYAPLLRLTLNSLPRRLITVVVAIGVLVGTAFLAPLLKVNFLGDTGQNIASITQTLPAGTSLTDASEKAKDAEKALMDVDGVQTVQTTIGGGGEGGGFTAGGGAENEVSYSITTDPDADQQALQTTMVKTVQDLKNPGDVEAADMSSATGSSSVDIQITGPTAKDRQTANDAILDQLDPRPSGVKEVSSDLEGDQPTAVVSVDRKKAAKLGLTEQAVVGMVAQKLNPGSIGTISLEDTDLDIHVQQKDDVDTLNKLEDLDLADGLALTDVAKVSQEESRPSIATQDNLETVTVSLSPISNDNVGQVSQAAQKAIDDADLPSGVKASLGGSASDISDTFGQLGLAMLAAILLVYVLLVWIFKSLVQPLVLLVSIPFAATGALGLLVLTGVPLGLPSMIGLLMLVGIVVTNAIVLIDLVNQYRRAGMGIDEAIHLGAAKRLRPILMTAAATIFALLPMAFGLTGKGGFISQPLAVVVIGGLVTSTLLTLVIVPVLYRITEGPGERRRLRREAAERDRRDTAEREAQERRDAQSRELGEKAAASTAAGGVAGAGAGADDGAGVSSDVGSGGGAGSDADADADADAGAGVGAGAAAAAAGGAVAGGAAAQFSPASPASANAPAAPADSASTSEGTTPDVKREAPTDRLSRVEDEEPREARRPSEVSWDAESGSSGEAPESGEGEAPEGGEAETRESGDPSATEQAAASGEASTNSHRAPGPVHPSHSRESGAHAGRDQRRGRGARRGLGRGLGKVEEGGTSLARRIRDRFRRR
ncbi:efflux RND transporter permease subunit [Brachybacterium endophyticum]|uniref:efflux RND transporter permease subunit n=1 Tax=Brachybacterium endophyticum TaxID=2182385 RepID=UPI00196AA1EF|nr:efflux RND transporter permease subunit [Brachybacterium endophyticum]